MVNKAASLFVPEDRKSSILSLPQASLGDAAVYYCIVGDTVTQPGLHLCRNPRGRIHSQGELEEYSPKCSFIVLFSEGISKSKYPDMILRHFDLTFK